ncbi:hypothetical protein PV326_011677, partial [Microctonus aethiopoides]
ENEVSHVKQTYRGISFSDAKSQFKGGGNGFYNLANNFVNNRQKLDILLSIFNPFIKRFLDHIHQLNGKLVIFFKLEMSQQRLILMAGSEAELSKHLCSYFRSLICFEIYSLSESSTWTQLKAIPKKIQDGNDQFFIAGLVAYDGPEMPQSDDDMGHYTAICLRGGIWISYDDLIDKEKKLKSNTKIKPKMIFYVKGM